MAVTLTCVLGSWFSECAGLAGCLQERPLKASLSVCSQISAGRTPQVLAGPLPPSLGSCPLQSTSLLLALGRACGSQPSLLLWPHITRASGSAIF